MREYFRQCRPRGDASFSFYPPTTERFRRKLVDVREDRDRRLEVFAAELLGHASRVVVPHPTMASFHRIVDSALHRGYCAMPLTGLVRLTVCRQRRPSNFRVLFAIQRGLYGRLIMFEFAAAGAARSPESLRSEQASNWPPGLASWRPSLFPSSLYSPAFGVPLDPLAQPVLWHPNGAHNANRRQCPICHPLIGQCS